MGKSGNRDGNDAGKRTAQKHKFYKFGGGGNNSNGERKDDQTTGGKDHPKVFPLDKYREKPLPEMLSLPGILISTTKDKEKAAELEIIKQLEKIADELYPESSEGKEGVIEEDLDFEEMLKRDLESMKDASVKSQRFRLCSKEGFCLIYVIILPPLQPHRLVEYILKHAESTGKCPLRHCKRLIPIPATAGATLRQLSEVAASVVKSGFESPDGQAFKFAVDTNSRNSDKLERMEMIRTVAEQVAILGGGHTVDLKNADKTILVEVYKNNLGVTVLNDYEKYKKYNPGAVATQAAQKQATSTSSSGRSVLPLTRSNSTEQGTVVKPMPNNENRRRRAASIADRHTSPGPHTYKRIKVVEEGETEKTEEDIEAGEVVEDEDTVLGDDFEEIIEHGRVVRRRKDGN
ncbi:hypothetical protein I314_01542 [Cryptococcus bacillisporus CA1873]|uniref:THUMP domain-containing protein n=1 Tax=Cryptococcus bacillisporus CA1873 TaxID=1296111 RepID=A0ABR5BFW1_CRYGA|nr:hypothetical protein I314_01542 [Cryptococcus bacillisporus CA1873]|eukprot:KIR68049.1 hypothetical protein I314_01542 [Cryptococcus gattii CA1873]